MCFSNWQNVLRAVSRLFCNLLFLRAVRKLHPHRAPIRLQSVVERCQLQFACPDLNLFRSAKVKKHMTV